MIRFKRRIHFEHGLKQIDIAPLIDIVFLLLVFFMLTSQFVVQMGFPIRLPKAVTSKLVDNLDIVVMVSREGVLYYDAKPITFKMFAELLDKNPDARVFIKADKNTRLETIVKIWDICRKKGVEKVHIATKK